MSIRFSCWRSRDKDSDANVTVIDGPFSEAKEVIGGNAVLSAAGREDAVEYAGRLLEAVSQGAWKIYPLYESK
jgi:hypothetical protein